jgi:hypothetical protein
MSISDIIQRDVQAWIRAFVEAPHELHDHKFPVCPFAQSARLQRQSQVLVYPGGDAWRWIQHRVQALIADEQLQVALLVLPPMFDNWLTQWLVHRLNRSIIPQDYYAMLGRTPGLDSAWAWYWGRGEYVVIGVNRLSRVLPAVDQLQDAGYYNTWSQQHFEAVVKRRQDMYERYRN